MNATFLVEARMHSQRIRQSFRAGQVFREPASQVDPLRLIEIPRQRVNRADEEPGVGPFVQIHRIPKQPRVAIGPVGQVL